jgi:general secretion pathway protein H
MPTSEAGVSNSGFTLLEMMVVLVIIGITLTLVTLSFRAPGTRPLAEQAQQVAMALNAARDESELEGRPLLFKLDLNGWHFYSRTPSGISELPPSLLPAGQFTPPLNKLLSWGGESNLPTELAVYEFWVEPAHLAWPGLILQRGEQKYLLKPDGLGGVALESTP